MTVLLHIRITLGFVCKNQVVGVVDFVVLLLTKSLRVTLFNLVPVSIGVHICIPPQRNTSIKNIVLDNIVHLRNVV